MEKRLLGIVVGGGPAPGINGVISAATIEACNEGVDVVGIVGGFNALFEGKENALHPLSIEEVSRIHNKGGSILRTSRNYPDEAEKKFHIMMSTLRRIGIDYLITIGGEGSLYMANWIHREAKGDLSVVHVPKTIDNDIPLPGGISTFGYQTARHVGVQIVQNVMEDARTMGRWYFITTMGRNAGHLALGIGNAAGATVTVIPEEFPQDRVPINSVADVLTGSIIKRLSMGKDHGVAILAEGIVGKLDLEEQNHNGLIERDESGRLRLSEIPLGTLLRNVVRKSLGDMGIKATIVEKNIGYELRAADPIPYDVEYTRNLGYGAVRFLVNGGTGSTIVLYEGDLKPVPFSEMMDTKTGASRVRRVDVGSQSYEVARKYMIRLEQQDLEGKQLRRLAEVVHMDPEQFKERFFTCTTCMV